MRGRRRSPKKVVSFQNKVGDAFFVVPRADGPWATYGHLASFVRGASAEQQVAFFRAVGTALEHALENRGGAPTWLSTAGTGVAWLHARLDSRPKYYRTESFKGYAGWSESSDASGRSRREMRRRRVRAAAEAARRASETEDITAEGNWPMDGENARIDL